MAEVPTIWRRLADWLPLLLVVLLASPFITHAIGFGFRGLTSDLTGSTYLFASDGLVSNPAMFAHMISGAIITFLAPFQLLVPLRRRYPAIHRWSGRVLCVLAVFTALAGLIYMALRPTIGGPLMSIAFSGYGLCVLVAAFQTMRFARARDFERHRRWALRMFFLAIGSWLYRVQYQIWYLLTGGLWMEPNFSGAFDLFQLFAFYVPYLIGLEIYFRSRSLKPVTSS
ncbi:MAG: DUF2306 domain-containing protein [Pseudomonadota bacterium]